MANMITCVRIALSVALLFCPALSPAFYALYIAAGLTDIIDGAVARKTDTVSELGSRLDTVADIVFTAVCLIKLLPVLAIPAWLYIWIAIIAVIKLLNIANSVQKNSIECDTCQQCPILQSVPFVENFYYFLFLTS